MQESEYFMHKSIDASDRLRADSRYMESRRPERSRTAVRGLCIGAARFSANAENHAEQAGKQPRAADDDNFHTAPLPFRDDTVYAML